MRIGVITTSFPRGPHDIAGHFVLGSVRALAQRGHAIEVLAPEDHVADHATHAAWLPTSIRITRVPYVRPRTLQRTFYGDGVPDNLRRDMRAWLGIAPYCVALAWNVRRRAQQWDAVISHWALPCGVLAALRPPGMPHLSVLHSADVHLLARLPGRARLALAMVHTADHLWFTSESLRDKLVAPLSEADRAALWTKSTCAPMGVDAPMRDESRELARERLGLRGRVALCLGRLVPVKGIEHAIGAVRGTDFQLVIAGDGPERERLRALAAPLGDRVRFVGVITGALKQRWLRASDVLLIPSIVLPSGRTEGVPTVALEAMSLGCPVIASDVGGLRGLITHGQDGWLVPPANATALRTQLDAMNETSRTPVAMAAEQTAAQHHWPAVVARWEAWLAPDGARLRG